MADKPYLQLFQSLFPNRFVSLNNMRMDITTTTGAIRIPVEFDIYSLDIEFFQSTPYVSLIGPCEAPVQEFVNVVLSIEQPRAEGEPPTYIHYAFEDYDPGFAPSYPTLLITWNVNSAKTLYWSAGGFA